MEKCGGAPITPVWLGLQPKLFSPVRPVLSSRSNYSNICYDISVILGHSYKHSFNAAMAAAATDALNEQGHHVLFHDLYRKQFNPVLSGTELVSDIPEDLLTALHQQERRTRRPVKDKSGPHFQYLQYPGGKKAANLRGSSGTYQERLRLRLLLGPRL